VKKESNSKGLYYTHHLRLATLLACRNVEQLITTVKKSTTRLDIL
jgi:hypothetical protein